MTWSKSEKKRREHNGKYGVDFQLKENDSKHNLLGNYYDIQRRREEKGLIFDCVIFPVQ